jgi:hypothetical protein
MKTSAKKSTTTTSAQIVQTANRSFFARAGTGTFFTPVSLLAPPTVQLKMAVNKPGDKFEQEADSMSDKVMRMPTPVSPTQDGESHRQAAPEESVQRQEMPEEQVQRQAAPEESVQRQEMPEESVQRQEMPEESVQRQEAPEEPVQRQGAPEEQVQRQEMPEESVQRQEAPQEQVQRQEMPEESVQRQEAPQEQVQRQEMPEESVQRQEAPQEQVQRQAAPEEQVQRQGAPEGQVQRQEAPAADERLQRDGTGTPAVQADTQSSIQNKTTGGQPLSADVRSQMESRFGADFSNVRIHSDSEAGTLNNRLSARAFTYRNHIFFSRGQYQPGTSEGQKLLAHELTHTIQQGHAVQRSPRVSTTTTPPAVQRLGVQDALDYFADKAYYITGFRMLTIVLGFNPINGRSTDRSAANILRALIELVPGGRLITQALDNHGVFTKAGEWVEKQLSTLGDIGSDIVDGIRRFLDSLSWTDIFDLGGVWDRAKRIFTNPIGRLISFGRSVVSGLMSLVKEAILRPLARMAEGTRGYPLLKAVLGEDPITGEPEPRNAETLIGGFMKLIGQEEVWENIKRGNAVARAWAWFQGALSGLMGFVRAIPRQVIATLASITWQDVLTIVGVFAKVGRAFLNIAGQFISWAGRQVMSLLEIIFSVVAPAVIPYLRRARGAFNSILQYPVRFVGYLVRAGRMGFEMFASRIGEHLKSALIRWIVGPLGAAGVYIPQSFSLIEILKLVLSVLGLTWQNIRAKLVRIIPEPVLAGLERTVGILVTLVREGPVAAWEQIKDELSELKDSLVSQITEMVSTEVVKAAVTKLASMLTPAGAVIQAIIAIYNTIMFFVQKINQIGAVVGSFVNSLAAIAAGQVTTAAKRVEQTMANTLTLIIAFLARFAGLGNIPEKVVGIIRRIRQPIDRGLDKIVAWLGNMLKRFVTSVARAGVPQDPNERLRLAARAAVAAARRLSGRITQPLLTSALALIKTRYSVQRITPYERGDHWWVRIVINPETDQDTGVSSGGVGGAAPTLVTAGSWVKNLKTNSFERVTSPSTTVRRRPGGETQAISFGTTKPEGGAGSFSYSKEGIDWERSTFTHGSQYVMPADSGATFLLKPAYRGGAYIRTSFYNDTDTSRRTIVSSKLPGLLHPSDPTQFLSEAPAAQEAARGYTKTFNGKAIVPVAVASPDHDPPIADHWTNRQGNNTTQGSRQGWNSSLSTYKLMSRSLNLSLGARGENYSDNVGIGFKGPGE